MIVLDTNVICEPLRARPDETVVSWLDAQIVETLYLTTVTLAELRLGIAVLPRGRRRDRLALHVEDDLLPAFVGRILAFDEPASAAYARLCARARAKGEPIGVADGYIAAIATDHDFAVATRDTTPFTAAGLRVINPFEKNREGG